MFDPDGETAVIIDDEGNALTAGPGAARDRRARVLDARPARGIALPVSVSREAERIARAARRDDHVDEALGRAPHGGRAAAAAIDLAASQEGGFIWPTFLPAYDAAATLVHLLDLLARDERPLSAILADGARAAHRARSGADAVGAQGRGDARDGRAGEGSPTRARRRREDPLSRRLGARAARSRDRGHARVGRSARATPRRAGWSRSTPARSPS